MDAQIMLQSKGRDAPWYLEQMRLRSVREVSSTNGTLSAAKIISGDS